MEPYLTNISTNEKIIVKYCSTQINPKLSNLRLLGYLRTLKLRFRRKKNQYVMSLWLAAYTIMQHYGELKNVKTTVRQLQKKVVKISFPFSCISTVCVKFGNCWNKGVFTPTLVGIYQTWLRSILGTVHLCRSEQSNHTRVWTIATTPGGLGPVPNTGAVHLWSENNLH